MKGRRIHWLTPALLALCLAWMSPSLALAQDAEEVDDEIYEDLYENEDDDRFAFGIGLGLVDPDSDNEIYLGANFRIRIGDQGGRGDRYDDDDEYDSAEEYNERYNRRHNRGKYGSRETDGIRGYLEPEIGFWSRDEDGRDEEDLLIGLNLIGVVPTRNADFYMGVGFGLHFTDSTISTGGIAVDESSERLGGNLQVGVDINMSDSIALFGQGRIDILEDSPNERQTKVWVGLRFNF